MGKIGAKSVWWMYAKSKLPSDALFTASISMMLTAYGITEGVLAIDDTDNGRAKKHRSLLTHTGIMIRKQVATRMVKS